MLFQLKNILTWNCFRFPSPTFVSVKIIENEIAKIVHDVNILDATDKLVVGFDAEWNVDTGSGAYQPTAIIQVAYKSWVNIFQIRHMNGKLPAALIAFLRNGQIIKVGCKVTQDLNRLANESQSGPFHGGLELVPLAKELRVISDARIGLADLCARILGKRLEDKDSEKQKNIRISKNWDKDDLTVDQKKYAALDAFASLCIYNHLVTVPIPGKYLQIISLEHWFHCIIWTDRSLLMEQSLQKFQK
ncbi:ribonuclease H-like domain-containing protein [Mycena epipterygia]|nr:ribonuclease H-like domain-containing protein [Mycena epipterygia]